MQGHEAPFKFAACAFALVLVGAAGTARAGGLYAGEFATSDMGAAGSGTHARADDASTALLNPAGMTYLDSHQLNMGLAPGASVVRFDQDSDSPNIASNNGGNQGGFIPLLSSSYVHKVSDRVRLGFGIFSISGASLDPKSDWAGRNQIQNLSLFTLSFVPTMAVRVTDWLSVGAGPAITYGTIDWKLQVPTLPPGSGEGRVRFDGLDDWGTAAIVSVMLEPVESLRIGFLYQSKTKLTLSGRTKIPSSLGNPSTKLKLPLAQAWRTDVIWQATDDLAFSAGFAYEQWDSLANTRLDLGTIEATIPLGLKDTWKLRGGVHYDLNEEWMVQTGVSYDSSALNTSDRTAALPLDEQWRWGIGAVHPWSEDTTVSFGFEWLHTGDANLDNAAIKGNYKTYEVFFFMVNLNFAKLPWDGVASF
jgi:long-chain fatty acid transport protein